MKLFNGNKLNNGEICGKLLYRIQCKWGVQTESIAQSVEKESDGLQQQEGWD